MTTIRGLTALATVASLVAACSGVVRERPREQSTAPVHCDEPAAPFSMWGDSLTYGMSYRNYTGGYPAALADLLKEDVYNGGVPGEKSAGIAARQGGQPAPVAVQGGSIPASGAVRVLLLDHVVVIRDEGTLDGTLAGVHGTLFKRDHSSPRSPYFFERTMPGRQTPAPRWTPFQSDTGAEYRASSQILWYGRNDAAVGPRGTATVLPAIAASVAYIEPCTDHYLVLSILNRDGEERGTRVYGLIDQLNNELEATYGSHHYLDVRAYLVSSGLADAGITPTSADRDDVADDVVPRSLRVPDGIHLTEAGYDLVAKRIYAWMQEQGWVDP